jgi:hypothetical protein
MTDELDTNAVLAYISFFCELFAGTIATGMTGQIAIACSCGASAIFAAGRCARCYRRHRADQRLFNGQREAVLNRDRVCLVCGSSHDLIVHHRRPPAANLRVLATLCRTCHPRIHQWNTLPHWVSPFMRQLWREANPEVPEQLPLWMSEGRTRTVIEQARLF